MTVPHDRRTRKRLATRQAISDAATRLFFKRGFDGVTVDEIADAADVGRMTVFNHFSRKEDLFFDLDEVGREDLLEALQQRDTETAPIDALHIFAQRAVADQKPYLRFAPESQRYIEILVASEALKARARAIRDELAGVLTEALAESVGRAPGDPEGQLAAGVLVTIWSVALVEAHRVYRRSGSSEEAQAVFLALVEKGNAGLKVMMAGTPYV
jgi:AcrR family transcriptional regulator